MTYAPILCSCGHPKNVHAMDKSTRSCTGHCYMFVFGRSCSCSAYRKAV